MKGRFSNYYPTDLIHGILSAHCADETGHEAGKSKVRDGQKVIFSLDNSLYNVFKEDKKIDLNSLVKDWRVLKVMEEAKNGYLGIIYCNDESQQLILVHRSTNFALAFTRENFLKQSGMQADFDGVLKGIITSHQEYGYVATTELIKFSSQDLYKSYSVSTTGHSLGSWLAQLSVLYAHDSLGYKLKAITFDGPGTYEMVKQLTASKIKGDSSTFKVKDLHIDSYFSAPNIVNCANKHIGNCYRLFPDIPDDKGTLESFLKMFGIDALSSTYGHHLKYILPHFEIDSGKPKNYQKVIKWPSITHKDFSPLGHETSSFGSILRVLNYLIKGEIDHTQFWAVHKYLDRKKGYESVTQDEKQAFELLYLGNYQLEKTNIYTRSINNYLDGDLIELSKIQSIAKKFQLKSELLNKIESIVEKYQIRSEKITIKAAYRENIDLSNLRDAARELIHRNEKEYKQLEQKIRAAYEIFKYEPETVKIAKYLSYLSPDEDIPDAILNKLFLPIDINNAKEQLDSIIETSPLFNIPYAIQCYIRNYYKMYSNPDSEILGALYKVLNSSMTTIQQEPSNTWEQGRLYFKHAESLLQFSSGIHTTELNKKLGLFYKYVEINYKKSLEHFSNELKIYEQNYDKQNHQDFANALANAALICIKLGNLDQALLHIEKSLEQKKSLNSADNFEIADILDCIGVIFTKQGKLSKGNDYFKQAFEMREKLCQDKHEEQYSYNISKSYNNFALWNLESYNFKEALDYQNKALSAITMVSARPYQTVIANYTNNLGVINLKLGNIVKAFENFEKALVMRKNLYKEFSAHPEIINSLENKGIVCQYLGKTQEGGQIQQEVLIMRENLTKVGLIHELTNSQSNLGVTYISNGNSNQALSLFNQTLLSANNIENKTLGNLHSNMGLALNNIGEINLSLQNKLQGLKELQEFYQKSSHPKIAHIHRDIGFTYISLQFPEKALGHFYDSLRILQKFYGVKAINHDIADILHNMGFIHEKLDNTSSSLSFKEKALEMYISLKDDKKRDICIKEIKFANKKISNITKTENNVISNEIIQENIAIVDPVFIENTLSIGETLNDYNNI